MSQQKIYIFSQPVRTGKTTLLAHWAKKQDDIAGFLTPDVDGLRKLYDLKEQEYHNLQLTENQTEERVISIGRFRFRGTTFDLGKDLLIKGIEEQPDWLVVDEVGKLEIEQHAGFEPVISNSIAHFKNYSTKGKLLLVIRDSLLEKAYSLYGLDSSMLVQKSFFE